MSALSTNTTTAYAGYENTQFEDITCHQATFQSSTEYSLLQSTTKQNSETNETREDALYSRLFMIGIICRENVSWEKS